MIYTDAEMFVLLWIICSLSFGCIVALYECSPKRKRKQKTEDEKALEWVNRMSRW